MSDFELYGDYNEIDEPPKKKPLLRVIKITALVLCFAVILFIGFRVFTFNYYPSLMKSIYFTDSLTEYYYETDGKIGAKTQGLRAPYDNADEGNFFCDHLIFVEDIGHLEITLRYNTSLYDEIYRKYSVRLSDKDSGKFHFSLSKNSGQEGVVAVPLDAELQAVVWDEFAMYRYSKIVFEGVDFEGAEWIRLEITIDGVESEEPFVIAIYENNADHNNFSDYKLSKSEVPKK